MQYGHFDDQNREYVITRPDTPQSWSNYLGSTEYGAIITNHAGGYGFYKSGARGRFLRLRFNSIPTDQPGRYFYLRDQASGDYWSASWQPVGKPLEAYNSVCRHGTGYTVIEAEYAGIRSQATYYIPLGQNFEYWRLNLTNTSDRPREIALFSYRQRLATTYGLMLCAPPFVKTSVEVMRAVVFNPGVKENAGIFNHTQGWGIMAECLLGEGDRAYDLLRAAMPAAYNTSAEIRQSEPYVQAQTTYSRYSPHEGVARTSWLSGAAAWFYYSATQSILGIQPTLDGLRIAPCIPAAWDGFTVRREFRGHSQEIQVHNPQHVNSGVKKLLLNGEPLPGNLIPVDKMNASNQVEAWLA